MIRRQTSAACSGPQAHRTATPACHALYALAVQLSSSTACNYCIALSKTTSSSTQRAGSWSAAGDAREPRAMHAPCAGGDGRDGECVGVLGVELRGLPTWDNRFGQYGIKVSFWGSGTLKIVIYVEKLPPETKFSVG